MRLAFDAVKKMENLAAFSASEVKSTAVEERDKEYKQKGETEREKESISKKTVRVRSKRQSHPE